MASARDATRKTGPRKGKSGTSRRKPPLWVRLLAAILSPAIFLLLIEMVLRLVGYGMPSHFFVPWRHEGTTVYVSNPRFCEHFVPKELSRAPEPSALRPKEASTIRIFVLGGSAANGDPEPAYGFCRQLEILLNEHSTGKSFEVVNVAVTSMNSVVARRIAADSAARDPDLFIVYMGNNEVVGPYGPPTLPASLYAKGAFIDASIALQKDLRLGQLLKTTVQALRSRGRGVRRWQGMEAFLANEIPAQDERLQSCYRHFQANIRDIVATARRSGAQTLLCTVPTNIASCAPFGSQHKPDLTEADARQWETYWEAGRAAEDGGNVAEALVAYEKAQAIDDTYADLAFSTGTCLLALDRIEEAKAALIRARDLDTLRFRADSRINEIIRRESETLAGQGTHLLDFEGVLTRANQGRPLGETFLVDHVHLNPRGNFLMARAAMELIAEVLPEASLTPAEPDLDQAYQVCCRRMLYDAAERYRLALLMYARKTRPPFSGQQAHDKELGKLRATIVALRRSLNQAAEDERLYLDALEAAPDDAFVTRRYGSYLLRNQRPADAIGLYQGYLARRPYETAVRLDLAKVYAAAGVPEEAVATMTSEAAPFPNTLKQAQQFAASSCAEQGRYGEALSLYRTLYKRYPHDIQIMVNLASAASHTGDLTLAEETLERALALDSTAVPAIITMGNFCARRGQTAEAHQWFEQAVEADPYNYIPQFNLGQQKLKLGHVRDGLMHVTQSVLLKPDFAAGYQVLADTYAEFDRNELAQDYEALHNLFAQ